ncbi:hypothetical protein EC988_007234, partial [Linderina pennispora]
STSTKFIQIDCPPRHVIAWYSSWYPLVVSRLNGYGRFVCGAPLIVAVWTIRCGIRRIDSVDRVHGPHVHSAPYVNGPSSLSTIPLNLIKCCL